MTPKPVNVEDARPADVSTVVYVGSGCVTATELESAMVALGDSLWVRYGLTTEFVIALSGDFAFDMTGSRAKIVRVIRAFEPGYGIAIRQAVQYASGRYLIIADGHADYCLLDAAELIGPLLDGAGLCVGVRPHRQSSASSFKARVARHLFGIEISDMHCRVRAITRACWDRQRLGGIHDELTSEILIKAALRGERVVERPLTRGTRSDSEAPIAARLRNFWSEARYLMMLSPVWLFAAPAAALGALSLAILIRAGIHEFSHNPEPDVIGNYWVILAAAMLGLSHLATMMALASHIYGVREGFRRPGALTVLIARRLSLEAFLLIGVTLFAFGLGVLGYVWVSWVGRTFGALYSVYLPVVGVLSLTLAGQTFFSGFLMSIIGGNRTKFLDETRSLVDCRVNIAHEPKHTDHAHAFVVLAFKDSPFLRASVASVCAQTRPSEVVIATSTPSPYIDQVAREFGVQVKVNPVRAGISSDWAFGISATDARYVTLAHQDDVYYPMFAEKTLETFERASQAALCFTGYEEIDDNGRAKSSKISKIKHLIQFFAIGWRERVQGRALYALLALGNSLPCSTVTYDRRRLADFQFSKDLASNLDWDAWMRLLRRGETFLYVNQRLVGRRHNALTETSTLIRSGRRAEEDLMMFRRLWPKVIGDLIAQVYRLGY